jgi:hypothetical protein
MHSFPEISDTSIKRFLFQERSGGFYGERQEEDSYLFIRDRACGGCGWNLLLLFQWQRTGQEQ